MPGQFASTMQVPASPFPYQSSSMATSNSQPASARASQPQPETGGVAMHPSSGSLALDAGANAFQYASNATGRAGEVDSRGGLAHDSQANGDRETDPQGKHCTLAASINAAHHADNRRRVRRNCYGSQFCVIVSIRELPAY